MTSWQEFPLRPQGRPWPGLNTRGGALDNGTGQLEDGSIGQIINEADILEKRKGFVRGLNEQFTGVVCGLFKYTDDCGREWVLVADEDAISIRQPFVIPVFEQSDAYPFDSFVTPQPPEIPVAPISTIDWRNTANYEARNDKLVLISGAPAMTGLNIQPSEWLRWFKDATNFSYQVRIEYEFEDISTEQHQAVLIKGNGDLLTGAYLQAEIVFSNTGTYQARLLYRDSAGGLNQLAVVDIVGTAPGSGFLTLKYQRDLTVIDTDLRFIPSMEILPAGGVLTTAAGSLNGVQDGDLGQVSATAVGYRDGPEPGVAGIRVIDGGPL